MSTKFIHSIKVPRLFKESAKTVKKILVDGASFKTIVFNNNHPNTQGIYALVSETLHHCEELQTIIDKTKILIENPRFDPWLARVLITELLWGKKDLKSEAKPITTVLSYREKLQQALVQNLDAALDPCLKNKVKKNPRYVRINTLLSSVHEILQAFSEEGWILLPRTHSYASHLEILATLKGNKFMQDFHIPEVLAFPPGTQFHDHDGYHNGRFLLQDKASCLSAFLLDPKPNSEILDMCAAPGMKTTHLAAIINNSGKVYAIEMDTKRFNTLNEFILHTNATCVQSINTDAVKILPEDYPNVEYILVDPSCSGSGMNRIEVKKDDKENLYYRLRKLQNLQSMILSHALLDFPNVKKVVYSTCSIYPEENECVVDEVIRRVCNSFELVDLKSELNNEWHNFGSSDYSYNANKCLYALPDKDLCNGFFLAVFKRIDKESLNINNSSTSELMDVTQKIENENINKNEDMENFIVNGQNTNDDISLQKMKKKKIKVRYEVGENIEENVQAELESYVKVKKCKKRKHKDETVIEENEYAGLEIEKLNRDNEQVPKKKKKKKSHSDEKNENIISENPNEISEIPIKKKKSKKKGSNDISNEVETITNKHAVNYELSTKKVKKHKRKNNDKEENEIVEIIMKKPKRNKNPENNISDNTSIEIVEDCILDKSNITIDIISTDDENDRISEKKVKKKKKDKKNNCNEMAEKV